MGSVCSAASAEEALFGDSSNQRAGTLMLVHIPADRSRIYSTSLMRHLWIGIAGHGQAKINAALAYGGRTSASATSRRSSLVLSQVTVWIRI
ncbi:MAG: LCP family protein [Arthrobacter sp.]